LESHAGEVVFEETLAKLDMPLRVKECQKTVFVQKPPEATPLDEFLPNSEESLRKIYERHRKLKACYEAIDRSLRGKKKQSYIPRRKRPKEQESLLKFIEQPPLDLFFKRDSSLSRKKPRSKRWRKIRFDMIFDIPREPALIFSEVKAFPTLRNGIIEERAYQLMAYDAWLRMSGDEGYTPLLLVTPTVISHKEESMILDIKQQTGRKVLPVCVTTPDYLRRDIERRKRKAKLVERSANKYEMDPEVVETYRRELEHLSQLNSLIQRR